MKSEAKTVEEYMTQVPEGRQEALIKIRQLCLKWLPDHHENMIYQMPSYSKNKQVEVAFASQKQHISVYILKHDIMLANQKRLKGINHGKGCLRFSRPSAVDFDLISILLQQTAESDTAIC